MSTATDQITSPNHNVNAAMKIIKWEGSREESVLRKNREGAELLRKAHMEMDADGSYWLGVVKLNDLDGTGQDLEAAYQYFECAHQRDHGQGLNGVVVTQKMMAERANDCIANGFIDQAKVYQRAASEAFDYLKRDREMALVQHKAREKIEFKLPETLLMP